MKTLYFIIPLLIVVLSISIFIEKDLVYTILSIVIPIGSFITSILITMIYGFDILQATYKENRSSIGDEAVLVFIFIGIGPFITLNIISVIGLAITGKLF